MYARLILQRVTSMLDILVIQLLVIFILYYILKTMIHISVKDYSKCITFNSLLSLSKFTKNIFQQCIVLSDQQKIIIKTTSAFLVFIRLVSFLPKRIDIIVTHKKHIPFFKYIKFINNARFLLLIEFTRSVCIIVFVLYIIIKIISQ